MLRLLAWACAIAALVNVGILIWGLVEGDLLWFSLLAALIAGAVSVYAFSVADEARWGPHY